MARRVKVAIVGSGLAGLAAGYLLTQPTEEQDVLFEVHLFEKASLVGMDASSVSLPFPGNEKGWRVDVPMRSFQGGYYPQLIALYKRLGVAFRAADFSYSFSLLTPSTKQQDRRIMANMIYNGSSGRAGLSMPAILDEPYIQTKGQGLAIRAITKVWTVSIFILLTTQIALCYFRMLFFAVPFRRSPRLKTMKFVDWAEKTAPHGILARWTGMDVAWKNYTQTIMITLFSAVCTAPAQDVKEHPVEEFLDYIWLTLGTHHYVVIDGVRDVVSRLTSTISHIHVSSEITSIHPDPQNPQLAIIQCLAPEGNIQHGGFHHIIFATQAIHAVPLLASYASHLPEDAVAQKLAVEDQIRCLKTFQYRSTIVVNHTDGTLMPDNVDDRRDLNLICLDQESENLADTKLETCTGSISQVCVPSTYTMATHVLPPPIGYPAHLPAIYQTTNPIIPPREDRILSVAKLERAILTVESKEALQGIYREEGRRWWQCSGQGKSRLGSLQGAGGLAGRGGPGLWICGSYAYAGIPLLEGCVVSAQTVVEQGVWESEGVKRQSPPW